ncbi:MAG TPA: hypothetical protein PK413_21040 [Thermoanaerobaculia bacterium]|nr:hypothetical protein [Thermoanaerobaculia bacterium]
MDLTQLLPTLAGLAGGAIAGWLAARKYVLALLTRTHAGRLEGLLEEARSEERLREKSEVRVLGEGLWSQLRRQSFRAAREVAEAELSRLPGDGVLVVDGVAHPDLSRCTAGWLLVFCPGRFAGVLPPGAEVTYANSQGITLDARLMELLRARDARERRS